MFIKIYTMSNQDAIDLAVSSIRENGYHRTPEQKWCQVARINGLQVPIYKENSRLLRTPPSEAELYRTLTELKKKQSFQLRIHTVRLWDPESWGLKVVVRNDCNNEAYVMDLQEMEPWVYPEQPLDDMKVFAVPYYIRWHQKKLELAPAPDGLPSYIQSFYERTKANLQKYKKGVWHVQRLSALHGRVGPSWRVPMAWAQECFGDHVCLPEEFPWLARHPGGDPIGRELKKFFDQHVSTV